VVCGRRDDGLCVSKSVLAHGTSGVGRSIRPQWEAGRVPAAALLPPPADPLAGKEAAAVRRCLAVLQQAAAAPAFLPPPPGGRGSGTHQQQLNLVEALAALRQAAARCAVW
jgi:hypothetical protein